VPLALLNQLDAARLAWLVPGMIRDKISWAMKALPKRVRTQLIPVPEHVTRFLESSSRAPADAGSGTGSNLPVKDAVLAYASRVTGERLDADIWSKDDPPPHLQMNIRVVDEARRELAMGRDIAELRKRLGEAASLTLAKAKPGVERDNVTAWDFGELPEQMSFRRGNQTLTGYPALAPGAQGDGLSIKLFDTADKARDAHREGVKRLMGLDLKEQVKNLERGAKDFNALALKFQATVPAEKLRADLVAAILDRAFIGEDDPPRAPRAFEEQKKRAKARLPAVAEAATRHLAAIVEASQQLTQSLAQNGGLGRVVGGHDQA
jgi:ATP-dependent helicase HrpA